MPEKGASDRRIRFGSFEADLQTKELFKEGSRVPLANQSFVALATLLERPGQLVSREELQQRLWPDNRVVEFDQGLNAIINRLRDALGDGPDGGGLIETLPRRGYRFIGTLEAEPAGRVGEPAPADRPTLADQPPVLPRQRRIGLAIVVSTLVLMLALVGWAIAAWLTRAPRPPLNLKMTPVTSLEGREVAPVFNGALAMHAAWAPGGNQIALTRQTDHDSGVFLTARDGGCERIVRSSPGASGHLREQHHRHLHSAAAAGHVPCAPS